MAENIEKDLDNYDYARLGICAYFGIEGYPVLYTDVYWRIKTKRRSYKLTAGGELFGNVEQEFKHLEFDENKPEGDPEDKYYLKYSEEAFEIIEKEDYTAVKLKEEGWVVLDNKKKL